MTGLGTMRTKEAAGELGVAEQTLVNLRHQGLGPRYVKIRGRVLYRMKDLEKYLEDHVVAPAGEKAATMAEAAR